MKKILVMLCMACILTVMACQPDAPEIKYTSTFPLNGEWAVAYRIETSPGVFEDQSGYTPLTISNTASDKGDSIWISDNNNFWNFKIKAAARAKSKSFSSEGSTSTIAGYHINVVVSDGKVFLDAVVTKAAKTITDSIYMKLEFEDDPGVIYHCSGVRRTGFLEDDEYYGF
ncbi:MAG TPA: lipid-binding protein [Cyclobacteriaceae bacterium]|nr:hypothetical protein [Cyclobacteriaceae bacterium]HMV09920.1 lipid-binding protein [Cyclobacteriaceae bacterium]HMV88870.1 lipid-binding protein [Cyclobacteriaceae bacterium]HMW99658.1 lipid-binding protein [Cyclobacteriaceae bacterium]HMX50965.1 lipid-binding protein [Cyclobacteriaceae bacterium]